jgi:GTP-binding protein Era
MIVILFSLRWIWCGMVHTPWVIRSGPPNAGKSTLLNIMCQTKISATSHKYNTTRSRVIGNTTVDNTQIIFHDTPGIVHESDYGRYVKKLTETAEDALESVDVIMLCIDSARRLDGFTKWVVEKVAAGKYLLVVTLIVTVFDVDTFSKSFISPPSLH